MRGQVGWSLRGRVRAAVVRTVARRWAVRLLPRPVVLRRVRGTTMGRPWAVVLRRVRGTVMDRPRRAVV
ncbi:hypothetical protein [Actinoplanes utahensis]|uniref:hypothetical protein n=1 Tax=Actinoplanes utahensis TaxID=1869 RepID=UPI001269FD3B|nr:hypothetical protein [Actinoplanes utahensis]